MKEQIKFIVEECDFETIHKILTLMNVTWKFHNKPTSVPTVEDIRNKAIELLEDVASSNEPEDIRNYSGIDAIKINGVLELAFVPVRSNPLSKIFN